MDLEKFINYVNGFHDALKFAWEISETCVSFLDIPVSINGDALATSVSYKPTDSRSYLLFSPCALTTPSNVYAFAAMTKILRPNFWKWEHFFVDHGYTTHLLHSAIQKAFNNSRPDTLKQPLANISDHKIPLVLTFHHFNYKVNDVISRNFQILKGELEPKISFYIWK